MTPAKVVLLPTLPILGGLVKKFLGPVTTYPSSSLKFFLTCCSSCIWGYEATTFSFTTFAGTKFLSWPAFFQPSGSPPRPIIVRAASLKGSPIINQQPSLFFSLTNCNVWCLFFKVDLINLSLFRRTSQYILRFNFDISCLRIPPRY